MRPDRWLALGLIVLAVGCTTTDGTTYPHADWPAAKQRLGRVVVVPVGIEEVNRLTQEALRALPGTEVFDPMPLVEALGTPTTDAPISDYEAVLAARKLNIDTVCLLTLGKYGGHFGMFPIPVVWHSKATIIYSLRLVDVRTGRLLLDAVRARSSGGLYAIKTSGSLPPELSEDLQTVLNASAPEPSDATGTGVETPGHGPLAAGKSSTP